MLCGRKPQKKKQFGVLQFNLKRKLTARQLRSLRIYNILSDIQNTTKSI